MKRWAPSLQDPKARLTLPPGGPQREGPPTCPPQEPALFRLPSCSGLGPTPKSVICQAGPSSWRKQGLQLKAEGSARGESPEGQWDTCLSAVGTCRKAGPCAQESEFQSCIPASGGFRAQLGWSLRLPRPRGSAAVGPRVWGVGGLHTAPPGESGWQVCGGPRSEHVTRSSQAALS